MRIAIIITGLSTGGAETMLFKLLERIDRRRYEFYVISLTTLGEIGPRITELGIPVEALGMVRGSLDNPGIFRLFRRLRNLDVALVHTWMYHADLLGGLAARAAGVRHVIWGIRCTNFDQDMTSLSTRMIVRTNAMLSRWLPTGILSCSEVAAKVHVAHGYYAKKMAVIPNGFDLAMFQPDSAARRSVREELGLVGDALLVGIVGRYDPLKNHAGFIEAAGLLHLLNPQVHYVMVGAGLDNCNSEIVASANRVGVAHCTHLLGRRDDMPRLLASLDVMALTSCGEAFPNVLGEAMACGVPCVVTDVGDCANIIGTTGRVVQSGDMHSLALAINDILTMSNTERSVLAANVRQRIVQRYEIGYVVRMFDDYYNKIINSA